MRFLIGLVGLCVGSMAWAVNFSIATGSTLTFTQVAPGDAAQTINPGGSGTGSMAITGPASSGYVIVSPAAFPATATLTSGTNSLTISNITASPASGSGSTDASGNATLNLGGTLPSLTAGQAAGTYTGTITIQIRDSGGTGPKPSASLNIQAVVLQSIGISKVSDIAFGQGAPGDAAKTITAGSAGSAQFNITGNAGTSYTITLPTTTVNMTTGSGTPPNQVIAVTSFASSPANTGVLSAAGTQTLYVGATRAALLAAQATGSYTGTFTVTVNY